MINWENGLESVGWHPIQTDLQTETWTPCEMISYAESIAADNYLAINCIGVTIQMWFCMKKKQMPFWSVVQE